MAGLDEHQVQRLERFLGRALDPAEQGSCPGFDRLTESQRGEVAQLARPGTMLDAILYLRFLLGARGSLRNAVSFVDNVVDKDMAVAEWLEHYFHSE